MCVAQPAPNPRLSVVAGVGLGRLKVGWSQTVPKIPSSQTEPSVRIWYKYGYAAGVLRVISVDQAPDVLVVWSGDRLNPFPTVWCLVEVLRPTMGIFPLFFECLLVLDQLGIHPWQILLLSISVLPRLPSRWSVQKDFGSVGKPDTVPCISITCTVQKVEGQTHLSLRRPRSRPMRRCSILQ